MIYSVFSIYDSKAEAFLPPFILPKQAQALRIFSDCVNSADHQFGANPEDYTLFTLGDFNDETGEFTLLRAKQSLGNGVEFVRQDVPEAMEGPNNGADTSEPQKSDGTPILGGASSENPEERV